MFYKKKILKMNVRILELLSDTKYFELLHYFIPE